jgi:hypothetical protein
MEREHLGGLDSDSHSARMPSKGQYLLHANMPNIRIALVISQFGHDLYSHVLGSRMGRGFVSPAGDSEMTSDSSRPATSASAEQRKPLSPAAMRALAEAEARRQAAAANAKPAAKESGGPKGPEPTRYGDWENRGIASDF